MEDIWGFQDLFIFSPRIRRFTLFFFFPFFFLFFQLSPSPDGFTKQSNPNDVRSLTDDIIPHHGFMRACTKTHGLAIWKAQYGIDKSATKGQKCGRLRLLHCDVWEWNVRNEGMLP